MNGLVYHIASGHAFFSGAGLILASLYTAGHHRPRLKRWTVLLFILGIILVSLSSTTFPYYLDFHLPLTILIWIACTFTGWQKPRVTIALAGCLLFLVGLELSYQFVPEVRPGTGTKLTIIGDSVTAGVEGDDDSETWPNIVSRVHQVQIQDISHIGETAASALERTRKNTVQHDVVLVEIGGNDLLGSTTSQQFRRDLDALLLYLKPAKRQVMMFELPLPPFCHAYGRIQRELAMAHGVKLIPKWAFLSVLADRASTLDTIHLSQEGHYQMAKLVGKVIGQED